MKRLSSFSPLLNSIMETMSTNTTKPATSNGHWSQALISSMNDPKLRIFEDDQVIVIEDKFPKAKFHYLVLPKIDISTIKHATKEHINLLKHMEEVGKKFSKKHKGHEFILGYHGIPSMQRLHLHVISTDFNSPCMKTKQHWNSYNTPFFLPSFKVWNKIQEDGQLKLSSETMNKHLKSNLKCHKCLFLAKNMPDLKKHILQHIPNKE